MLENFRINGKLSVCCFWQAMPLLPHATTQLAGKPGRLPMTELAIPNRTRIAAKCGWSIFEEVLRRLNAGN